MRVIGLLGLVGVVGLAALAHGENDFPTAQVIQQYKDELRRCEAARGKLPPAEGARCFNLRIRIEQALVDCGTLESYPAAAKERHASYPEAKEVCDLLRTGSAASSDQSRGEATRMEQERLKRARTDCERQWGNLTSMVEHCERTSH